MLLKIRSTYTNFETLRDKIKIIPNFKDTNCNFFIYLCGQNIIVLNRSKLRCFEIM